MVIGNLCPMTEAKYRNSRAVDHTGAFCQFSVDLLKRLLCLSRVEVVSLPGYKECHQMESIRNSYTNEDNVDADMGIRDVTITEGSTIILVLSNFPKSCLDFTLLIVKEETTNIPVDVSGGLGRSSLFGITISVIDQKMVSDITSSCENNLSGNFKQKQVSVISVAIPDDAELMVGVSVPANSIKAMKVFGKCVGDAIIKITYPHPLAHHPKDLVISQQRYSDFVSFFVRIRVIPRIPVRSSEVHELIGLLEAVPAHVLSENNGITERESYEQARYVFRSQCMSGGFSYEQLDQVFVVYFQK